MTGPGPVTLVRRGIAAEWTRTTGRSFLWTVAVPLTFVLPLVVTFGIAAVAERLAKLPGQQFVAPVSTTNSVYWVITLSVAVMMVTAAYAHATQWRGQTSDLNAFLFPRSWTVALARWIYYGTIAAISTAVLLVVVMVTLPRLFPELYGAVDITDSAGIRFLWTVPSYAFAACGVGVAVGSLIHTPSAAVAVLLFWVYVVEIAMNLLPHGYTLQAYAPFLNAVAATGQEVAFVPRFGRTGSLLYFILVAVALFVTTAVLPLLIRRRSGHRRTTLAGSGKT
ncbi:ABC transporter permease [Nocardia sp. CDC159]|uniref:ABC transporter permease n=1 Tax=Nocardia pulmonis TaxID=2951408 RepID=A0A9X2J331_9NOCA|nr:MULTISPECIES: ABC transporter permease [Nocardia]MCM6778661.1 ABC transporter permease [Nocardia pulmonis]MCM6791550.1 ABC transporter permease [Nocardia sp. CDC159]